MNKLFFFVGIVLFFWGVRGWTQSQNQLFVFKNGTGFFVKNIETKVENNVVFLKEVPNAVFGTLWFSAEGNTIKSITSAYEEMNEKEQISSLAEQIRGNVNKKVTVTLQNDTKITGTIEPSYDEKILSLKTSSSWYYTSLDQLKSIDFLEKPESQLEKKQKKTVLKIGLAKSRSNQALQMTYLQKNISWTPNYVIYLLNEKEARIKLEAILLNDSEDLTNTFVNFVVGVPNFMYDFVSSPLTSSMDVNSFLSSFQSTSSSVSSSRLAVQSFSNADFSADGDDYLAEEQASDAPAENQGTFQKAEDLLFYQVQDVYLKKGERGSYEIIHLKTTYEHLYEIDLTTTPQTMGDEKIYLPNHYIAVENSSKVAWTTGSVLLNKMHNNVPSPISQGKLNYTPVKGKAKVFLTQNTDIHAKRREQEVGRTAATKEKDGYVYETVSIAVTVEVKNYKTEEITIKITDAFSGEPVKCNRHWKTTKQVNYYQPYNSFVNAEWDIALKAGAQETFIYEYQRKIRR